MCGLRYGLIALFAALSLGGLPASGHAAERLDGFNVIAVPEHQFGSASAKSSLLGAKRLGARALAVVPFLWQSGTASPAIGRGSDMPDIALRAAIRDIRALGLAAIVKPHVWVPESWAGAVEPTTPGDWAVWFQNYRRTLTHVARIAAQEKAEAFAIGTELRKTTHRPEWRDLIAEIRAIYPGTVFYVAHNADEAERITFWPQLDAVGVSLYPPLGADDDREGRRAAMSAAMKRVDVVATRTGKPVIVGEIGLRSATGAASKPWESAEERPAPADPQLQAKVLADWLTVLDRPSVQGVLIWRWLSDPGGGGLADTDFTVQGKPAEGVLTCAWTGLCGSSVD